MIRRYTTWVAAFPRVPILLSAAMLLGGCSGGQSGGSEFSPDDSQITVHVTNRSADPVQIRYVYGRANAVTLGSVGVGGEEVFRFRYSNNGDLRLTGEFLNRRAGTSNPIMDLRPGESLDLSILQSREMRLERRPTP